ncbi:uncharacterized protein LOC130715092 isoform X2 [Lotus japonicus]|uniref:uncharacterized protein LOC130715092 isoform X2 n=1 Tax=Lotus japonicus TaxID=34305 RepID=UPI0025896D7F|nr:uncharacterized protein LOC130715092 isoform X2 [Lotus japonicus]
MRTSLNTRYPQDVVRELHRVYSVQKMLMDELKGEIRQQRIWNPMSVINVSHPHSIEHQHQTTQFSFHVHRLREDLGSRERSGSDSGETNKMERGFDLEKPAEEDNFTGVCGFEEGDAGPSSHNAFQSSKISACGSDEDMEVDLTLSIGGSMVKNSHLSQLDSPNGKTRELNSSASFKSDLRSDRVGECSDTTTPISSSNVKLTQEKKGEHWLSKGLQLK